MTYSAFLELVKEMRSAQDLYFKKRTPELLGAARALEYKVDKAIAEHGQSAMFK